MNNRDKELTGRISGHEIKQTLKELEENKFTSDSIVRSENKDWSVKDVIDLVLATNMISVGIDIERFNIKWFFFRRLLLCHRLFPFRKVFLFYNRQSW